MLNLLAVYRKKKIQNIFVTHIQYHMSPSIVTKNVYWNEIKIIGKRYFKSLQNHEPRNIQILTYIKNLGIRHY